MHYYMAQLNGTVANLMASKPIDPNTFLLDLNNSSKTQGNASQHKNILLGIVGITE